jgi:hypothetical protein
MVSALLRHRAEVAISATRGSAHAHTHMCAHMRAPAISALQRLQRAAGQVSWPVGGANIVGVTAGGPTLCFLLEWVRMHACICVRKLLRACACAAVNWPCADRRRGQRHMDSAALGCVWRKPRCRYSAHAPRCLEDLAHCHWRLHASRGESAPPLVVVMGGRPHVARCGPLHASLRHPHSPEHALGAIACVSVQAAVLGAKDGIVEWMVRPRCTCRSIVAACARLHERTCLRMLECTCMRACVYRCSVTTHTSPMPVGAHPIHLQQPARNARRAPFCDPR